MMMVSLLLILASASESLSSADAFSDVEGGRADRMAVCRIVAVHAATNPLMMAAGAESMEAPLGIGGGLSQSIGSGFVIEKDDEGPLMVTNAHVVADSPNVFAQFPAMGQYTFEARVVLVNHDMDLAFVKVQRSSLDKLANLTETKGMPIKTVELYRGKVTFGMKLLAMGFPLGSKTIKLSTGILSGHEDVKDFVVYQHTSPISPGSSGGPLFLEGTLKVVAVNFATAARESSQQNNYAIPAYRVAQMILQYNRQKAQDSHGAEIRPVKSEDEESEGDGEDAAGFGDPGIFGIFGDLFPGVGKQYKGYDRMKCESDRADPGCEYRLPKLSTMVMVGNKPLYEKYGCSAGVMLSSIENESYLKFADPPIEAKSFLYKVNGVPIDRFGMGIMEHLFDDPIRFEDILFSGDNVAEDVEVVTCSCGKTTTHTVSLKWSTEMEKAVPLIAEPAFASLDYEQFAGVTVSPLTMNTAAALLEMGRKEMAAVVFDPNPKAALVITAVEPSHGEGSKVNLGDIVTKLNGIPVQTMAEFRNAFPQVAPKTLYCGARHTNMDEDVDGAIIADEDPTEDPSGGSGSDPIMGGLMAGSNLMEGSKKKAQDALEADAALDKWILTTQSGAQLVKNYKPALQMQIEKSAKGLGRMTPAVKKSVKKYGFHEAEDEIVSPLVHSLATTRADFVARLAKQGHFHTGEMQRLKREDGLAVYARAHHKTHHHHRLRASFEEAEPGSPEREAAMERFLAEIPAIPIEQRVIGRGGNLWVPLTNGVL